MGKIACGVALLAMLASGCAAPFYQTDGFRSRLATGCGSVVECSGLNAQADDRVNRCQAESSDPADCAEVWKDKRYAFSLVEKRKKERIEAERLAEKQAKEAAAEAAKQAEQERLAQEEDAKRKAKIAYEEERLAAVRSCSAETDYDCLPLVRWAAVHEDTERGAEARLLLMGWEQRREDALAEKYWETFSRPCVEPERSIDCDAVSAFLDRHADSAHAAEGRAAVKRSSQKLSRLKAAEIWKQQAEERQAKAAKAAEEAEARRRGEPVDVLANDDGVYYLRTVRRRGGHAGHGNPNRSHYSPKYKR